MSGSGLILVGQPTGKIERPLDHLSVEGEDSYDLHARGIHTGGAERGVVAVSTEDNPTRMAHNSPAIVSMSFGG